MSFPGTEHYREKAKEGFWLPSLSSPVSKTQYRADILALCDHIEDLEKQNEQAWERAALEARRVLKNGSKALKLERQVEEQDKEIERLRGALQELREYSKPHGGESPSEAGLQDIVYEMAGAALSQTKESK